MGDSFVDAAYDEDKIFKHLCFYIDTPANARTHNMALTISPTLETTISEALSKTRDAIIAHGGKVTDNYTEPKLTHVVIHEKDKSRRVELMRRTSK